MCWQPAILAAGQETRRAQWGSCAVVLGPAGWTRVTAPQYKFTTTVEYMFTPEPATLSLLALGGLALLRRRRGEARLAR